MAVCQRPAISLPVGIDMVRSEDGLGSRARNIPRNMVLKDLAMPRDMSYTNRWTGVLSTTRSEDMVYVWCSGVGS